MYDHTYDLYIGTDMSYSDPKNVRGPKKHVSNVRVIYDGGEGRCAVAELEWDGEPSVGIRWNGSDDDQPLGHPQSRGNPIWFQLPEEFSEVVRAKARELVPETSLEAGYREMAGDTDREDEALEWANALMDDVCHAPR
ncbi:hypothetical protein EWI61_04510 [Methylolobus aquaticus]|nr:hypothetical protein EWI61_04510 [Methylolobus aquaticus]